MFEIRSRDLNWLIIVFLCIPLCAYVYSLARSRLSPAARRFLVGVLVAQLLVVAFSLAIRPTSLHQEWLWAIDGEWNIPSMSASTQLALVAGVALLAALFNTSNPVWQRLYLLGVGAVFLFLGVDEFFDLRPVVRNLRDYYIATGAAIIAATAIVIFRRPRRLWIWSFMLLLGLSLVAFGGLVFDDVYKLCGTLLFLRPRYECFDTHFLEELLELLGSALALVAMLGHFSEMAPRPRIARLLYILPFLWIVLLISKSPVPDVPKNRPRHTIQTPSSVRFESGEYLYGYHIELKDDAIALYLYSFPWESETKQLGYSIHLVDQVSGDSVARSDGYMKRSRVTRLFGEYFVRLYVQEIEIDIQAQIPVNRAYRVTLALWSELNGDFVPEQVTSSDLRLLNESSVVLGEIVIPGETALPNIVPVAKFDNGFALVKVEMPESAAPGEALALRFDWFTDKLGREDHVQFLHLRHESSGNWLVFDQQPLGARLPTRLWYPGLLDSETWQIMLPDDLAPGRYSVFTGLYRTRDQTRVAAEDSDGAPWLDARVPLGIITIA